MTLLLAQHKNTHSHLYFLGHRDQVDSIHSNKWHGLFVCLFVGFFFFTLSSEKKNTMSVPKVEDAVWRNGKKCGLEGDAAASNFTFPCSMCLEPANGC